MAYIKNNWVDQDVERPKTYEVTNNQDGSITLTDSFGVVTEIGTPVNAVNMNHIEEGIADNDTAITTINSKIPNNASSENKMITLEDVAPKLHALKGYSEEGELLTDSEGLADVKTYAHSTFDSSKFTVVGSPSIADDGIASGFSGNSSYVKTNSVINLTNATNFDVYFKFMTGSSVSSDDVLLSVDTTPFLRISSKKLSVNIPYSGGRLTFTGATTLVANTNYWVHIVKDSTSYKLYISTDGVDYSNDASYSSSSLSTANNTFNIGAITSASLPFTGTINLKGVNITVDGVEVFSGNKTGIDTVKADDYSIIDLHNSIAITDDGIASGFWGGTGSNPSTSQSYIYKNITLSSGSTVVVEGSFVSAVNTNNRYQSIFSFNNTNTYAQTNRRFGFETSANGQTLQFSQFDSSGTAIAAGTNITSISTGVKYTYKLIFKESSLKVYLDGEFVNEFTLQANIDYGSCLIIGMSAYGSREWFGSIDLNDFRVYSNGNLVYQPCLKIPYTLSKTGSKIVQSVYRDRVSDMYSQYGYAPYYTLSDTDFTLPQGELYGMIGNLQQLSDNEIGLPVPTLSDVLYKNEVWLQGAEVSKSTYSKLYAIYGDRFGTASSSDKFVLPNFTNRVMWGISNTDSWGYIQAGLPNIKGKFRISVPSGETTASGAFSKSSGSANDAAGGDGYGSALFNFDAHNSNTIYDDNITTVQPPAIKVKFKTRYE